MLILSLLTLSLSVPPIPEPVLAAYPDWGLCGSIVDDAIDRGVNTLIWFASNFLVSLNDGKPTIQVDLDLTCVKDRIHKYPDVVHLISIGGWNAPHPADIGTGAEWFAIWKEWNKDIGFHGIDWDLEGNDSPSSPYNTFSLQTLKLMTEFTKSAVAEGYHVAMAPPQSYLDPDNSKFSRSLQHPPSWKTTFPYHGSNIYAHVIASCGIDSFAFIAVQVYEGWSRLGDELASLINEGTTNEAQAKLIESTLQKYTSGWEVDFSSDSEAGLPSQIIRIPASKIVLGVANYWAEPPPSKFVFIEPAVLRLVSRQLFKGFMFWCLKHEGDGGYYFSNLLADGNPENEL